MTSKIFGRRSAALATALLTAGIITVSGALAPVAQAADTTKLRITIQLPKKNILGQNLVAFKEIVEKESKGSLSVEIYDSAQLYKDKQVPQAVASGAIEMGVAALTRFAGTIPTAELFFVPFMFDSNEAIAKATSPDNVIRQKIDASVLTTGARILWWQPFGLAVMLSKDEPMASPASMKDKKVRVFGKILGEFVRGAGGAPTLMSGSEQFLAYQRGTVDAGMTGVTAVKSRKLSEVMDYTIVSNHAAIEFVVLINEKVWQGLSEEQRSIVSKAGRKVEIDLRKKYAQVHEDTLTWIEKDTEMKVVRPTAAQMEEWREIARPVWDTFVKRTGPDGAELVEAAGKLR